MNASPASFRQSDLRPDHPRAKGLSFAGGNCPVIAVEIVRQTGGPAAFTAKIRQDGESQTGTRRQARDPAAGAFKLGYCSRTQAETLISAGRVTVNGRTVTDPSTWVDLERAQFAVDDIAISAEEKLYFMLNKPRGLVTTRDDPDGRPTVYDCPRDIDARHLAAVGRLDKASEGLLLFTNDTVLAQALLDPVSHVGKVYHVQVDRIMDHEQLERMERGIIDDGELRRPAWPACCAAEIATAGSKSSLRRAVTDRSAGCWRRSASNACGLCALPSAISRLAICRKVRSGP